MTQDEKIKSLRIMLGDSGEDDADETLSTYLDFAGRAILDRLYPYDEGQTEVPLKYGNLQVEIALYMMNKRGGEGETAHTENGITRNYGSADVPEEMLKRIVPHVGVIK